MKKYFIISLILFICICSKPPQVKVGSDSDNVMIFPLPPAQPRIQFLRSYTGSDDIEKSRWLDIFIESEKKKKQVIGKPYGVAIRDGKIYVGDTMLEGLEIFDLIKNKFRVFKPLGIGTLRKPVNIAFDETGNLYVADIQREEVVIFDTDLAYKNTIKSTSLKPVDIAIYGDTLIITDLKDNNLEIWSIGELKKLSDFPPDNQDLPDSIKLAAPISVDVDELGNIYVCDFGQFRVQKFDQQGNFIRSFGEIGRVLGQFARPKGIAVDRKQRLYVVDAAFENIQIFNKDGELLMFFGGAYQRPGNMYLPAQVTISYDNLDLFEQYVITGYTLEYLILVSNQYGPDKIGVYGFINPIPGTETVVDSKIAEDSLSVKDSIAVTNLTNETIKDGETVKKIAATRKAETEAAKNAESVKDTVAVSETEAVKNAESVKDTTIVTETEAGATKDKKTETITKEEKDAEK